MQPVVSNILQIPPITLLLQSHVQKVVIDDAELPSIVSTININALIVSESQVL